MPLPRKACKYCLKATHWPYQCFLNPKTKRYIKNQGKQSLKWIAYRKEWIILNPGPWTCYLCGKLLNRLTLTLDHVIPRSRAPQLRYTDSNIAPACGLCNTEKGSKVIK